MPTLYAKLKFLHIKLYQTWALYVILSLKPIVCTSERHDTSAKPPCTSPTEIALCTHTHTQRERASRISSVRLRARAGDFVWASAPSCVCVCVRRRIDLWAQSASGSLVRDLSLPVTDVISARALQLYRDTYLRLVSQCLCVLLLRRECLCLACIFVNYTRHDSQTNLIQLQSRSTN